jgi:DNA-directed RNA polymerase specialized sigma24 family protein
MNAEQAIGQLHEKSNDPSAWEIVYKHMHIRLSAYVASLLVTFNLSARDSATDVVHESLCKFWEKWPDIQTHIPDLAAAEKYLKAISRHALIDRYRSERSAKPLIEFLTLRYSEIHENDLMARVLVDQLSTQLPAECGALFRTYTKLDLSLAELAIHEGLSPSAFYSRWYRCIKRARELADR